MKGWGFIISGKGLLWGSILDSPTSARHPMGAKTPNTILYRVALKELKSSYDAIYYILCPYYGNLIEVP